jgi:hypothetical protein
MPATIKLKSNFASAPYPSIESKLTNLGGTYTDQIGKAYWIIYPKTSARFLKKEKTIPEWIA